MRLRDLNPKLSGTLGSGILRFDCPLGHPHKIRVPVSRSGERPAWKASGAFPDTVTLTPSINAHSGEPNDEGLSDGKHKAEYDAAAECGWHGFITNGEIRNA
jgi:hypothetical protein